MSSRRDLIFQLADEVIIACDLNGPKPRGARGTIAGACGDAYNAGFTGIVLADSEHDCRDCASFIHVRPTAERTGDGPIVKRSGPEIHHVDPNNVRMVNGKAVCR